MSIDGTTTAPSSRLRSLFDIPTALWAYGALRALAFAAPAWDEGSIGLGAFVAVVLYVFVLRRSRWAWFVLVFLDLFTLPMLFVAWLDAGDVAAAAPLLTLLALVTLLLPSVRCHVGAA